MSRRLASMTLAVLSIAMFSLSLGCAAGGSSGSSAGQPAGNENAAEDTGDDGDESPEEFTISDETFSIGLEDLVPFDVRPDSEPARQRADLTLFTEKPADRPSGAQLTLDPENVVVLRPGGAEGEADGITGLATVDVYIASISSTDPCNEGTRIGSYRLTFDEGVVSVVNRALPLTEAALERVVTGSFSLCLEVSGEAEVRIIIDRLAVEFGPASTDLDGGDEGLFAPDVALILSYRGDVLETEQTHLALGDVRGVTGLRVYPPGGEALSVPPRPSGGFHMLIPGAPEEDAPYTFEALDEDGNPISDMVCDVYYDGIRVEPPRGVEVVVEDGTLVVTWNPVPSAEGFDPPGGVGWYSAAMMGADVGGLSGLQGEITSQELEGVSPGTYTLSVSAFGVGSRQGSCSQDPADFDCESFDLAEYILVTIDEDGTITLIECETEEDCDDGVFCSGVETCDAVGGCQAGTDPCVGQICDESAGECVPHGGPDDTIHSAETVSDAIEPEADVDSYTFTASAGDTVIIQVSRESSFDGLEPGIDLYAPGGSAPEVSVGFSPDANALLQGYQLAESGQYTIVVRDMEGNDTGGYSVSLVVMPGPTTSVQDLDGGWITSGLAKSGDISFEADTDAYVFSAEAGQTVIIQMSRESGFVNPGIDLYPPGGGAAEVSAGDASGETALLGAHQLAESGQYTIVVRDLNGDHDGEYSLSLTLLP